MADGKIATFDGINMSISVLSVAHKIQSHKDRYFTLIQACKMLIAEAIFRESEGSETPTIYALYEL